MDAFQLARRPPQWLRAMLAGLLLVFLLASVAHASHHHEADAAGNHAVLCGYCAAFTNAAGTPAETTDVALWVASSQPSPTGQTADPGTRPVTSARPRAPPLS